MAKSIVVARVLSGDQLECQITPPRGDSLTLTGSIADVEPTCEGSDALQGNRALVDNAWAFAKFTHLKVSLPSEAEQKSAEKRAKSLHQVATWIADLVDDLGRETKRGWCSGCFTDVDHRKVIDPAGPLPAYLCTNCGSPTMSCAGPGCENMAICGQGAIRLPRYCAEHRQEIPGFAKAADKMDSLGDYSAFLEYDKANLGRTTKLVGAGLAAIATGGAAAFAAAPAIGGAIGSLVGGYSGAAASSYGLALLGGGSLAAGGLGIAGGTAIVAVVGGGLGGVLGASVANAYVREDKSFHIEMLQGGERTPVIVCNGLFNEAGKGWGGWQHIVTQRYPDSPVYVVHWGSKELKDLATLLGSGAAGVVGPALLKKGAMAATKAGAKMLTPLAPALAAANLAKNPWNVAKSRANKTGVVVADLLARTKADSYVLVGHSLGARAMVIATQALGTKSNGPTVEAMHLLGAAIGASRDWSAVTAWVDEAVYNYHSTNDDVLKYVYSAAQVGQKAAGCEGCQSGPSKLVNVDVSTQVDGHRGYHAAVTLR